MDGTWQLGHGTPHEYGQLAMKTARAMRQIDPDLELIVCGSSNAQMPTFAEWERIVLEETYDEVDYISCHAYYEPVDGDFGSFLASAANMDRFIESIVATADHVKAVRGSDKSINISFDEWNVWYHSRYTDVDRITGVDDWPVAPRLLEDSYSVADAVVVGNLLISLLRHADRVTAASLAQLVNVIAPIMTEPGGPAWRQTTFFPFALTSRLAEGRDARAQAGQPHLPPRPATARSASWTRSRRTMRRPGETAVFLVNRSLDEDAQIGHRHEHPRGCRRRRRAEPARLRHACGEHPGAAGARRAEAERVPFDRGRIADDLASAGLVDRGDAALSA